MQSFRSRPSLVQHSGVPGCTGKGASLSQDLIDNSEVWNEGGGRGENLCSICDSPFSIIYNL